MTTLFRPLRGLWQSPRGGPSNARLNCAPRPLPAPVPKTLSAVPGHIYGYFNAPTRAGAPARRAGAGVAAPAVAAAAPALAAEPKTFAFEAGVEARVERTDAGAIVVTLKNNRQAAFNLHWSTDDWAAAPDASVWPPGTFGVDAKAVQTPVPAGGSVNVTFKAASCPSRMVFVLRETSPENW